VNASDVQKNFGVWHDKALQEPVQITKYGRETVYLISADTSMNSGGPISRPSRPPN
jgi:PHD/YefM family antitoxin component YafN of YafNO toxin-antitoxin module